MNTDDEIDLGPLDCFCDLPAKVEIGHDPYWLVRINDGEYKLFSGICPHAGGEIRPLEEGILLCPLHFWTFNASTGQCTNVPDVKLLERKAYVRNGRLIAARHDE